MLTEDSMIVIGVVIAALIIGSAILVLSAVIVGGRPDFR